jgi:hypothetical protein
VVFAVIVVFAITFSSLVERVQGRPSTVN